MTTRTTFAAALRHCRRVAGFNQTVLAEQAGFSRSAIYKWERGERPPDRTVCALLAAALGVSESTLWHPAVWDRTPADELAVILASQRPDDSLLDRQKLRELQRTLTCALALVEELASG